MRRLNVGDLVGAQRWPREASHPSNWGTPWQGTLLDATDPRAWAGTIAFSSESPDPAEVKSHVLRNGPVDKVPVLWDFGGFEIVFWESPERIRSYSEDYMCWLIAREKETERVLGKSERQVVNA